MTTNDAARIERERAFHDERFTNDDERAAAEKYYSASQISSGRYFEYVDCLPTSAYVVELGCGLDGAALRLAARGVRVTAVDISSVAVDALAEEAAAQGLSDLVDTRVADAEDLDLAPGSVDAVVGSGILHHLDLERAFRTISTVLTTNGVGVFFEPLGGNPVINAYRNATPAMRTPDEHPLIEPDFELARSWFEFVDVEYFNTLSLAAFPLRSVPGFPTLLGGLDRADQWMYRQVKSSRALAWTCVLRFARPLPSGPKPGR